MKQYFNINNLDEELQKAKNFKEFVIKEKSKPLSKIQLNRKSLKKYLKEETKNPIVKKTRKYPRSKKTKKIPKGYYEYIKSQFWTKRKIKFFKDFGKQCKKCSSKSCIQLHHVYYDNDNNGNEPNDQLVALCENCHEQFHANYGVEQDMKQQTEEFLRLDLNTLIDEVNEKDNFIRNIT